MGKKNKKEKSSQEPSSTRTSVELNEKLEKKPKKK